MSTGPSGGGSSDNTKYYVLVGATFLGGAVYVSMFFFYVVKQLIAWYTVPTVVALVLWTLNANYFFEHRIDDQNLCVYDTVLFRQSNKE